MNATLIFAACATFGVIAAVWRVTTERRTQRALIDAAPDEQRSAQIQIAEDALSRADTEGIIVLLVSMILGVLLATFAQPLLHSLGVWG